MKRKTYLATICILLFPAILCSCSGNGHKGTTNSNGEIERKVDSLVSIMTLDEKIGQMNQVSVTGDVSAYAERLRSGEIGSVMNLTDPDAVNQYQKIAVEESRLHIPLLIARDVIHGFHTIFPIPLGMASTFDTGLMEKASRIAACEATAAGIRWSFAPMCDLARDSRWGRIAESGGEDPLLSGSMAAAMVRGFQTDDPSAPDALAACVKHFAGYGASEGGRDYNSANISPRQFRNFYLVPYEDAVKAGAMTVMTSFNDIDGIPSTGNPYLLKEILRKEWGYDGLVVSDWSSAGEMVAHGFAKDEADAARIAVNAGCEMDMMSFTFISNLKRLVDEGLVKKETIDEAVKDILRIKFELGLFDHPYTDTSRIRTAFYRKESLAAAEKAAEESAVLLKNEDNALPLDASRIRRILVTGPMADNARNQIGTWAFDGDPSHVVTPLAALREKYGKKIDIVFYPALKSTRDCDESGIAKAAALAGQADVVIAFLGEEAILSGEAHCLAEISLKGAQGKLLEALHKTGKPIITSIMAGRGLCIGKEIENSDALLYSFHPGTMGGEAIIKLLFGEAAPSGKLPVTLTRHTGESWYYDRMNTGRPATGKEVLLDKIPDDAFQTALGNTSFYMDSGSKPLFPFGFGLSYAEFELSGIKLDKSEYALKDSIRVYARLSNVEGPDACEVVQLYVRDVAGSTVRPIKELKAFKRVEVPAGRTCGISFVIPVSDLAFYGADMTRKVEPGDFELWVAKDSDSGTPVKFSVTE